MQQKFFSTTAMIALVLCLSVSAFAQQGRNKQPVIDRQKVLRSLQLANRYFMNEWPDAAKDIYVEEKHKSWPSHIWTRGVYYEGLMSLYKIDPQATYLDYTMQWGNAHNWDLRGGSSTRNADNQCAGQTYIDMALVKKDTSLMRNIKASMDAMLTSDTISDWSWIDAIQMAMPVFARLGALTGDNAYYHKMWQMYHYTRSELSGSGLYDTVHYLWWRDKDFMPPYKEPNGADCYWSRGNGWVCAALVRVLERLPKNAPHYTDYLKDYKDMMRALLPYQNHEGYWNVSIADPADFGGKELTGTALFTYAMAWGLNRNMLDKKIFGQPVYRAWSFLAGCVHPNGFLGYVQGTGKEPKDGQPVTYDHKPDFEDFGLGCFLLAGSEVYRLGR